MKKATSIFLLIATISCYAQKKAYIPLYLLDNTTVDGKQFTWSKTQQSANFTLIWGDFVGTNPMLASNPDLVFNPTVILNTMETVYQKFIDLNFARDVVGTNLHKYKIPIVMYNTFGPTGATGFANGGDADGVIGAFWVHPMAMKDGHVASHELTHALQAQNNIDYRTANNSGIAWKNLGIFYETHANFMECLLFPTAATNWGMDLYGMEAWGQWKNTYVNYHLLLHINETDGIENINKMWQQCYDYEYPIAAYKRLQNYTQQQLNDKLFGYARRMVTLDFPKNSIGDYLRQNRAENMNDFIPTVQTVYTILRQDAVQASHFVAPYEIAPEEYGYNIIPLNPIPNSCAVIIKFKGHTDANAYAGWRYGFVTQLPNGKISRYSDTYSAAETTVKFTLLPTESKIYLVVMGAPNAITTDVQHDTWKGYPKHYRFPYELTITGANPEGYQAKESFRSHLKTGGHYHPNGGGWVSNVSTVDNSVYVAPNAMVIGSCKITGNVKINNTAIVKDATISNNVQIKDNAMVIGGNLSGNAIIAQQAFVENSTIYGNALVDMRARVQNYKLYGNIHVGGDVIVYNITGKCDNGTYYRMTNYYEDNLLECDGRTENHPDNLDVNNKITPFTNSQMSMLCDCTNYPNCLTVLSIEDPMASITNVSVYPNPASNAITIDFKEIIEPNSYITIYNMLGSKIESLKVTGQKMEIDISKYPQGIYNIVGTKKEGNWNCKILVSR